MRLETLSLPYAASLLDRLAALHEAAFQREKWSAAQLADSLALDTTSGVTVSLDAVVQGFLLLQVTDETCEILTFCVAPTLRRRGLGRALLARAIALFPCHRFFLEVAADNAVAQALYEQMGFTLIARRPHYYHHRAEKDVDALCYTREPSA